VLNSGHVPEAWARWSVCRAAGRPLLHVPDAGSGVSPLTVRSAARNAELNGERCVAAFRVLQCGPSSTDPEPVAEVGGWEQWLHPSVLGGDPGALLPRGSTCCCALRCPRIAPYLPWPVPQAGLPAQAAFTLVVANILMGPLVELAGRLAHYAAPGATLLLSGILQEQVPDIRAAYDPFFHSFSVRTEGTWAAVTAVRKA
jgi:hypothetical protein